MDCNHQIHMVAYHNQPGFQQYTPGYSLICKKSDYFISAGLYKNSIDKKSVFVAVGQKPITYKDIKIGYLVSIATGYDIRLTPIVAGVISYKNFNFVAIPQTKFNPFTIGTTIEF